MSFNFLSNFQIISQAVILQTFFTIALSYKYDVLYEDEGIYSPCEMPNVKFMDDYLDRTNVTYEFQDNGDIYAHGDAVWLKDIGSEDVPLRFEIFKKQRGEWINTIYTIIRPDFCVALFASTDIFNPLPKNKIEEKCPLYKGRKLHFDKLYNMKVASTNFHIPGEYKIQEIAVFKKLNETFCANVYAEIYKSFG